MKLRWPVGKDRVLKRFKPKRYTTIIMMLVVWAGVMGALLAGISTDLRTKDFLLGRAVTIADALPVAEVASLHGNGSDSDSVAYRDLKDRLERLRNDQGDLRFAYLLGKNSAGKVFFYVDSEAPSTNGYTPPGETYNEANNRLVNAFDSSEPFIQGPFRDRWGSWISAIAPIHNPKTNRTIALVGIDISASSYYEHVALYVLIPLLLAAIPLAGLLRDRKLENKESEIGDLKQQFVSIASHELRSPLAGMLWAEQSLLKQEGLSKQQESLLMDMYRSTEASIATVNEILDLSIFQRGQIDKLQHEQVDLAMVIKQVIATLRLGAQEKKVKVEQVGDWPEHVFTVGDVAALKRAYMNLVSNAIKYSFESGKIEITYRLSNGEHIVAIRDYGIGIPPSEQVKVLGGYYRATNATKLQSHGTGLGLWLAKMLAEQHHGRLWLHSRLNHGTTIYMALPVAGGATTYPIER